MKTAHLAFASALLPLLALGACTSVDDPFLRTGALDGGSVPKSAATSRALASLPGLRSTDVRDTRVADRIEQAILYPNATALPGENSLSVVVAKAGAADMKAPTRTAIVAEMREAVPDVALQIAPDIRDNAYGVFGFATASLGGKGACLYAWQTIRHMPAGTFDSIAGLDGKTSASIRLRYCDPAASAESLAALMQGLRLGSGPAAVQASPTMPVIAPVVVNDTPPVKRVRASKPMVTAEAAPETTAPSVTVPLPAGTAKPSVAAVAETAAPATPPVASPAPTAVKIPLPGA